MPVFFLPSCSYSPAIPHIAIHLCTSLAQHSPHTSLLFPNESPWSLGMLPMSTLSSHLACRAFLIAASYSHPLHPSYGTLMHGIGAEAHNLQQSWEYGATRGREVGLWLEQQGLERTVPCGHRVRRRGSAVYDLVKAKMQYSE